MQGKKSFRKKGHFLIRENRGKHENSNEENLEKQEDPKKIYPTKNQKMGGKKYHKIRGRRILPFF